jgi:hypothetical protein
MKEAAENVSNSTEPHVLVANRESGELRAVPREKADTLSADWFVVCREPEDLQQWDPSWDNNKPVKLELVHHHDHGQPQLHCPRLWDDAVRVFELTPPEDWQACDLNYLHSLACDLFRQRGAVWSLELQQTPSGAVMTSIEITTLYSMPGRRGRHPHSLRLKYAGRPNAATIAWFVRHCDRFGLTAAIGPTMLQRAYAPLLPQIKDPQSQSSEPPKKNRRTRPVNGASEEPREN